ncbi:MAG: PEP-CTERM sorting domain-containing protein [Cyanobacteria bacterium J06632_3]
MSIFSKSAAIALGATCLAFSVAPATQAGTFYNGWNYAVDAQDDGYGGSNYEIGGIAFQETEDSFIFAVTGGTPLGGHSSGIAWGDLFLNFTGQDFQTASDNNSLFAVRFDEANESGASSLGLYSDVSSKSISTQNYGYATLDQYGYRVDQEVVGQEEYTATERVVTGQQEVPATERVWVPGYREYYRDWRGRRRSRWVRGHYEWQETTRLENTYGWEEVTRTRNVYDDVRVNSNYGRSENAMGDLEDTSGDVYEYLFGDRTESEADQIGLQNVIDEGTRVGDVEIVEAGALAALGLDFGHLEASGPETFGFRFDKNLLPDAAFIASVFLECANDGVAIHGEKRQVPEPTSAFGLVLVGGMLVGSRRLRRQEAVS